MTFQSHDSVLFLAMYWSGGGPFQMWALMWVYDWINRDVLTHGEIVGALNRLIAAGLVQRSKQLYSIPLLVFEEFDKYRKRRRKNRFEVADAYLKSKEPIPEVKRRVRLTKAEYKKAYKEYSKQFQEALDKVGSE